MLLISRPQSTLQEEAGTIIPILWMRKLQHSSQMTCPRSLSRSAPELEVEWRSPKSQFSVLPTKPHCLQFETRA